MRHAAAVHQHIDFSFFLGFLDWGLGFRVLVLRVYLATGSPLWSTRPQCINKSPCDKWTVVAILSIRVPPPLCTHNIQWTFSEHFSEHSVNIQWTFSEHSVNIQWTFSEHSVNIQWAFSEHSVNIQWAFSEHSVNIQWSCPLPTRIRLVLHTPSSPLMSVTGIFSFPDSVPVSLEPLEVRSNGSDGSASASWDLASSLLAHTGQSNFDCSWLESNIWICRAQIMGDTWILDKLEEPDKLNETPHK